MKLLSMQSLGFALLALTTVAILMVTSPISVLLSSRFPLLLVAGVACHEPVFLECRMDFPGGTHEGMRNRQKPKIRAKEGRKLRNDKVCYFRHSGKSFLSSRYCDQHGFSGTSIHVFHKVEGSGWIRPDLRIQVDKTCCETLR